MTSKYNIPTGSWTGKGSPADIRDSFLRRVPGFAGISKGKWRNAPLSLNGERIKYGSRPDIYLVGGDELKAAALAYARARGFKKTPGGWVDAHKNIVTVEKGFQDEIWVTFK